jgi:hypothetical protein
MAGDANRTTNGNDASTRLPPHLVKGHPPLEIHRWLDADKLLRDMLVLDGVMVMLRAREVAGDGRSRARGRTHRSRAILASRHRRLQAVRPRVPIFALGCRRRQRLRCLGLGGREGHRHAAFGEEGHGGDGRGRGEPSASTRH